MNIRKMIDTLREQIAVMQSTVESLEKLEAIRTGVKKRGRPPLPRCERGCGRPVHKGRCRGYRFMRSHPLGVKRTRRRTRG